VPANGSPTATPPDATPEPNRPPSALGRAVQLGLDIDGVQRQIIHLEQVLSVLRRQQENWAAGARGEQSVVQVLVGMDDARWHVLPDRRWPGTRRANIDVILVGHGGVFVVDVKNWREATVSDGRLLRGDADAADHLEKLADQTVAVEEVLVAAGLPPTEVVPMLVLAGRRNIRHQLGRIVLLGEQDLARDLARRGARLSAKLVERVKEELDRGCPPMPQDEPPPESLPAPARPAASIPRRGRRPVHGAIRSTPATSSTPAVSLTPVTSPPPVASPSALGTPFTATPATSAQRSAPAATLAEQEELFSRDELWQELLDAAGREPIEGWMTWLHPTQARLTSRSSSGPARIRGAAGTGKTVVALHRAKYLAARGNRVLFTTLVNSLGPVYQALMARMAPEHVHRIEFLNVHAVANRCLKENGETRKYDEKAAATRFWLAWAQVGQHSELARLGLSHEYWKAEIFDVIKSRGLTDVEQYARLSRVGRSTPLQPVHRRAVWTLFERYEFLREERRLLDSGDVLRLARDLVRAQVAAGDKSRYDAVIVDEVQDLGCVGVQFLHAFVGDRRDGLLLVGDGQQTIYPGGFTLAEAGISVVGRSTVLTRNYRNRENILRYAQAVVGDDSFDDLDGVQERGRREVEVVQPGGEVHEITVTDEAVQESALCAHLTRLHTERDARFGDMAVLAPTKAEAAAWLRVLGRNGIPAISLEGYDGQGSASVKVGTYHRAKSLDFTHVALPDRNRFPRPQQPSESDDGFRERLRLERRRLFVAITRARDTLWAGIRPTTPDSPTASDPDAVSGHGHNPRR
jgi:hypothetical protein